MKSKLKQSIVSLIAVTLLTTGVTSYAAYTREKEILVTKNDIQETVNTKAATVGALLEEQGYQHSERTRLNMALDAEITDYMNIVIDTSATVRFSLHDREASIHTSAKTVGEFLEEQNVTLGEHDTVVPAENTEVHDGMTIAIDSYRTSIKEENIEIPFETVDEYTEDLYEGESRVTDEGQAGTLRKTHKTVYYNGKVLPTTTEESVVREARNKVVEHGTAVYVEPVQETATESASYTKSSSESYTESYSSSNAGEWMTFTATAYDPTVGDTTRMGTPARVGVIAVDPNVIPLGSVVEIEGYGTYSAEDTGSAIIGRKVDIFLSSHSEAINFGVRTVRVRVLY